MKDNKNLHTARKARNDELTPAQRAKRKYAEKHRIPDEVFLVELRDNPEDYVPIKGCENYEISRDGNVYFKGDCSGRVRRKSHFVKKTTNRLGYNIVHLDRRIFLLHRLLAEAFIDNPENKPEVDHIIPLSLGGTDTIDNIRWVTHKENLNNEMTVKKQSESHTGLVSNIKGRKKIWVDKENKIYKMI